MDDTQCDYKTAHLVHRENFPAIAFPQSVRGFFENLESLPDAIDTFHWLRKQSQFDVFVLTAPSVKNPLFYMEKQLWVEKHLGFDAVNRVQLDSDSSENSDLSDSWMIARMRIDLQEYYDVAKDD